MQAMLAGVLVVQFASAQLPTGPPVWQMNLSTIIMPCGGLLCAAPSMHSLHFSTRALYAHCTAAFPDCQSREPIGGIWIVHDRGG